MSDPARVPTSLPDALTAPALTLAAMLRRGDLSASELTAAALDRAEQLGPRVGAFVTVSRSLATAQADAADTVLTAARRGGPAASHVDLPPFLGVPCPVKDLAMVAGERFTAGSGALRGFVAPADDGVVRLLRDAGTVMLGKTNTPELGLPCYTEPDVAPPARSPWDLRRSAGGSSGGAAAAVAAGITPVAHGSDGGGSLRIPASACGLVALKATRGRVSWGPDGVDGLGLATNGVLTRTIEDTAAFLDVLARPWPGETFRVPPPEEGSFLAAVRRPGAGPRLRVGLLATPVITHDAVVDPECVEALRLVGHTLESLGHHIEIAPAPFPAERWAAFRSLWGVLALQAPVPPEAEPALRPLTRWLRGLGRATSGLEVAQAVGAVQQLTRATAQAWDAFDVVISPTLARPAAFVGELRDDDDPAADFDAQTRFTPWTSVANLTGMPALSVPTSWPTVDGHTVPVGVMLHARWGQEALLLRVGAELQTELDWRARRPDLAA